MADPGTRSSAREVQVSGGQVDGRCIPSLVQFLESQKVLHCKDSGPSPPGRTPFAAACNEFEVSAIVNSASHGANTCVSMTTHGCPAGSTGERGAAGPSSRRKSGHDQRVQEARSRRITLGAPHTSQVKGSSLRELRPRRGSSPWRALYRRVGDVLVIAAIAPEAKVNPRGFARGVRAAETRLSEIEEEG